MDRVARRERASGAWVYRKSMLAAAGFDALPQDFGGDC